VIKIKFKFPDTGEGVTEGQFLEWNVEEGDKVEEDQVVGEAETDKAVVEIPAPADGTVKALKASPGDTVAVGDTIMILDTGAESSENPEKVEEDEGSDADESSKSTGHEAKTESSGQTDAVMGGSPSASSYNEEEDSEEKEASKDSRSLNETANVLAMPRVRKKAREKGINLEELNIDGKIEMSDLEESEVSKKPINEKESSKDDVDESSEEISEERESKSVDIDSDVNARPSVRKLAREHHIELSMLDGSGRDGEITREDVLNAADVEDDKTGETEETRTEAEEKTVETSKKTELGDYRGEVEIKEMSGVRKVTAQRMKESKFTAPHVTHVEKADITELVELRNSVKNDVDAHLTYLPFIMKACVAGLKEYPRLNSEINDDESKVILKNFYDFNIAVDTEKGLMVPRIEDVDKKNMIELAADITDMAGKAQDGELSSKDMSPGSFSITNLGVIGGEAFTPIIYPPQSAILGVGKIQQTAEVIDGEIQPRHTVKLSLSYDHRVVDGAEAAKFMNKVVEDLETPKNLILDL